MNRLTVIACLSTLLLSPMAQADWEGNWVLGVTGSYNEFVGEFDMSMVASPLAQTYYADESFNVNGWSWGGILGYQVKCNDWVVGAELNVDWDNDKQSQNYSFVGTLPAAAGGLPLPVAITADFKRETTIGLTGRLGYQFTSWLLPYARLGLETSRDRFDVYAQNGLAFPGGPLAVVNHATFAADAAIQSWRGVIGIGAEIDVPYLTGLALRAEYDYHSRSRTLNTHGLWSTPLISSLASAHNYTNTARAAIVYNFNI